jgi:hypothetical protein
MGPAPIDTVDLAPHFFASLVAPAIDRAFTAGITAGPVEGRTELSRRYGGLAATGCLVEFRTRLAASGGIVSRAGFAAVTRYRDPTECQRSLDKQVAYGMVSRVSDNGFQATERGRAYLADVYALHATTTRDLWGGQPADRIGRLIDLLGRLLDAATSSGGDAYTTMAPPHEPDGTPPGVLLLNRLGTLRYHRADAHAVAWTAAGHTAQSISDLAPGPERRAIEQETDRRAAPPYSALTPTERLILLAELAALNG